MMRYRRNPSDRRDTALPGKRLEGRKRSAAKFDQDVLDGGDFSIVKKRHMGLRGIERASGHFVQVICRCGIDQRPQAVADEVDRLPVTWPERGCEGKPQISALAWCGGKGKGEEYASVRRT